MPNFLGRDYFGIYVHWPFCAAKCPYCDFNSHVGASIDHDQWAQAYVSEIKRLRQWIGPRQVTSVFFGGGTPSLMHPKTVSETISAIQREFTLSNDAEITLEANPTSSEARKFQDFYRSGVNRVSIGVQSLRDADLKRLGRQHSASEALETINMARGIFPSVSFDLMYGRQDQTVDDWNIELREALALDPDHISLYQLTIEPQTAFGRLYKKGKLTGLPDDDLSYELFDLTHDVCASFGLEQYEVSNFAKSGHMSRHNRTYWLYNEYAGIGPGAHGRIHHNGTVYATETELTPQKWLSDSSKDQAQPTQAITPLSPNDQATEMALMALRLHEGISRDRWDAATSFINIEKATLLIKDGLLDISENSVRLTKSGRPLLNAILHELLS